MFFRMSVYFMTREKKQSKCSGFVIVSPASASNSVIKTTNGATIDDQHKLNIRVLVKVKTVVGPNPILGNPDEL